MCFYLENIENYDPEKELTLDEISRFSRNYGPLTDLSISGGEPFLRRDIGETLKIFAVNNRPRADQRLSGKLWTTFAGNSLTCDYACNFQ